MGNWKAWFVTAAVCLMTLLPAPAQAVQWMLLGESEEGLVSMDRDSLKLTQDERYLKVWEKVEWPMVSAQGIAGELRHQEYDLKEKKWRQLSVYALNTKGQKVTGSRKIGEWQPFQAMTALFTRARYEWDYARLNGPWVFSKTLPKLGKKWFNPQTLEKKGSDTYEVWEKTWLKEPANGTEILLSHTRYDLSNGRARTLYLCTFNSQGVMTDHYAVSDAWSQKTDQFGEYIGPMLASYYAQHHHS